MRQLYVPIVNPAFVSKVRNDGVANKSFSLLLFTPPCPCHDLFPLNLPLLTLAIHSPLLQNVLYPSIVVPSRLFFVQFSASLLQLLLDYIVSCSSFYRELVQNTILACFWRCAPVHEAMKKRFKGNNVREPQRIRALVMNEPS